MTKAKGTKHLFKKSVFALMVCIAMLVGTTFAWFTDSVTSGSNVIESGNLDLEVQYTLDGENWSNLDGVKDLFQKDLWEPGHTEVVALKVENKGSLALKYTAKMNTNEEVVGKTKDGVDIKLSEILKVSTLTQQTGAVGDITVDLAFAGENRVAYETTKSFNDANVLKEGKELLPGDAHYVIVKVDMPETVGNEANHDGTNVPSIDFGINVLATQYTYEEDSFGNQYDKDAGYPVLVSDMEGLKAAAGAGNAVIDAKGADLGDFYYDAKFADGTVLENAKFTYFYGGNVEGTVTFNNCEFVSDHSYSANFDSGNGKIIFNNCTFDGWSSFGTAITNVEMNNCTFQKSYNYGILRFYQNAQLNNCTFKDGFEGIDTNVTGKKVEFNNCTGVDGKIFNNGSNKGIWIVNGVDISDTVTSW